MLNCLTALGSSVVSSSFYVFALDFEQELLILGLKIVRR